MDSWDISPNSLVRGAGFWLAVLGISLLEARKAGLGGVKTTRSVLDALISEYARHHPLPWEQPVQVQLCVDCLSDCHEHSKPTAGPTELP